MEYRKGMDLTKYLEEYNYFPRFTKFLFGEIALDIRNRGYLNREDLALICTWKSLFWQLFREERNKVEMRRLEIDEQRLEQVTKKIFTIDHLNKYDITKILKELRSIDGVGVKVASTILSVVFPDKYGIFDRHIKKCLQIKGDDEESCVEAIILMRTIAQEQTQMTSRYWTPRMVDKALWKLGQAVF